MNWNITPPSYHYSVLTREGVRYYSTSEKQNYVLRGISQSLFFSFKNMELSAVARYLGCGSVKIQKGTLNVSIK